VQRRDAILGLTTLLAGCASRQNPAISPPGSGPVPDTREAARRALDEAARQYERLMVEHGRLEWSRYAGKTAEGPAAEREMKQLRARERSVFQTADAILLRYGDELVSPRQAALWRSGALGMALLGDAKATELADKLEAIINDHEFELDGKRLTRGDLVKLKRSDDAALRRQTRRLEHQLHRRAAPVARELLLRRRQLAVELGVGSFYSKLLELRGVDPKAFDALLTDLDAKTRLPHARLITELRKPLGRLPAAWDIDYAVQKTVNPPEERFTRERALPSAFALYRAFGVDLEKPKLDVTVRDFAFGGQTIGLSIPDDVRLVLNPLPGVRFQSLVLHELGHAYAMTRTREEHALYKGYEWVPGLTDPAFSEGIADVFARLLDEPRVLTEHLSLAPDEAERLIQSRRADDLLRIRRALSNIAFERAAIEQPEADLDQLSLVIERRYGSFGTPMDAEPVWAASPFFATYPVYVQSYLLASLCAVQVRDALKARFGAAFVSPEAGRFLTEQMVADGARWTFREKLIRATGRPLEPGPLLAFVSGRAR
jgi:Zn-dependent M32 family carboxypeptidase